MSSSGWPGFRFACGLVLSGFGAAAEGKERSLDCATPESIRWGDHGHTLIGRTAAAGLPAEMPRFVVAAAEQLAFLNPEPDRWRDERERRQGEYVRLGTLAEHYVLLDLVPAEIVRAPHRNAYLGLLAERRIISPVEFLGPNPGLLHFRILELTQSLRIGFRRWRETSDSAQRAWIEARIIDDAGILGHYVADASNPHHTTVHIFGWLGENPKDYATDPAFHSRFETRYVESHITAKDMQEHVPRKARVLHDLAPEVLRYVERSHSGVERLYQLDRQERFGPSTVGADHKAFTVERLTDAAAMLRDLWWTAWVTSGA